MAPEPGEVVRFRAELRDWLEQNCPAGMRDASRSPGAICWGGRKWAFEQGNTGMHK